jgi:hypothetical protein
LGWRYLWKAVEEGVQWRKRKESKTLKEEIHPVDASIVDLSIEVGMKYSKVTIYQKHGIKRGSGLISASSAYNLQSMTSLFDTHKPAGYYYTDTFRPILPCESKAYL